MATGNFDHRREVRWQFAPQSSCERNLEQDSSTPPKDKLVVFKIPRARGKTSSSERMVGWDLPGASAENKKDHAALSLQQSSPLINSAIDPPFLWRHWHPYFAFRHIHSQSSSCLVAGWLQNQFYQCHPSNTQPRFLVDHSSCVH